MKLVPVTPNVELIGYSKPIIEGSPEIIVAAAAKLCYSKSGVTKLLENLNDQNSGEFINKLMAMGHQSPVEHTYFTFGIEGISRACSHQLVRHRIASYSQQSQRYVDISDGDEIGYVIPPETLNDKNLRINYEREIQEEFNAYRKMVINLYEKYLSLLPEATEKEKKAIRKKALEDARYLLPNACETKLVMSMNARSLMNFLNVRCCERSQWEIRDVANQTLDIVNVIAPNLFSRAGAPCTYGKCPEGVMSCGNPKVKKLGGLSK